MVLKRLSDWLRFIRLGCLGSLVEGVLGLRLRWEGVEGLESELGR